MHTYSQVCGCRLEVDLLYLLGQGFLVSLELADSVSVDRQLASGIPCLSPEHGHCRKAATPVQPHLVPVSKLYFSHTVTALSTEPFTQGFLLFNFFLKTEPHTMTQAVPELTV